MKRVFRNHSELAHIWAQRKQSEGRAGNMLFDGDAIYSWGKHWTIARFHDTPSGVVVLVNNNKRSVSTSQHANEVRGALHGLYPDSHVFHVDDPDASSSSAHTHNVLEMVKALSETLTHYNRVVRVDDWQETTYQARVREDLTTAIDTIGRYCNAFGVSRPDGALKELSTLADEAIVHIKKRAERTKQLDTPVEKARRQAKRKTLLSRKYVDLDISRDQLRELEGLLTAEEREVLKSQRSTVLAALRARALSKWYGNEHFEPDESSFIKGDITRCRIVGDTVGTSRGAYVPVVDARRLFALWCRVRGRDYLPEPFEKRVGHYELRHVNANGSIQIGCHTIEREAIDEFLRHYNWNCQQAA